MYTLYLIDTIIILLSVLILKEKITYSLRGAFQNKINELLFKVGHILTIAYHCQPNSKLKSMYYKTFKMFKGILNMFVFS